ELEQLLSGTDVIICVTSSPETVIDRAMLERADRNIIAIDIAVPRDIDPAARDLPGFQLRDIEDLRQVVEAGAERRRAELPRVEEIVEEEVDDFCAWERSLALGPAIESLREWAERIREADVAKLARKGMVGTETLE